jgi:hypothetical protein
MTDGTKQEIGKLLEFLEREIDCGGSLERWEQARALRALVKEATIVFGNASMHEAWRLTHSDRRNAYGTPAVVFAGYAKMWSGLLAKKLTSDLTASDVALMMTALKLAREANHPGQDNVVDAHGYLILLEEIK